jgi:hypothetical protein
MSTAATETGLERQVREEQEAHDRNVADGTQSGEDAEKGKLFEVPRVAVTVEDSDPNVLKLNFSGSIELERASKADVEFYNRLTAGKNVDLEVQAFVTGPHNTHRRDSEGNVDAVVQTKSLKIHSLEMT